MVPLQPWMLTVHKDSRLGRKQELAAYLHAIWVLWVYEQGWRLRESEGYVGDTDAADGDYDGPHKWKGGHYNKLARDYNLFLPAPLSEEPTGWRWADKGTEPEWALAGAYWEKLHPLCRWGGRIGDANHLGLLHDERY